MMEVRLCSASADAPAEYWLDTGCHDGERNDQRSASSDLARSRDRAGWQWIG